MLVESRQTEVPGQHLGQLLCEKMMSMTGGPCNTERTIVVPSGRRPARIHSGGLSTDRYLGVIHKQQGLCCQIPERKTLEFAAAYIATPAVSSASMPPPINCPAHWTSDLTCKDDNDCIITAVTSYAIVQDQQWLSQCTCSNFQPAW